MAKFINVRDYALLCGEYKMDRPKKYMYFFRLELV